MTAGGVDVSICIATFQRPDGLARLLDSLDRLKIPSGIEVEILVVDNDASGSASAVVASRSTAAPVLRYFLEPEPNIACARNRAIEAAQGRWLMFIDDDEVADENWLIAYLAMFDSHECDGAFGPVTPRLEEVGTSWLDLPTFYARRRHATGTILGEREPRTGNAMVRRSLFDNRRFDPAFGRTGGSDLELFGAMCRSGARFLWCDEAQVSEFLPPKRHQVSWLARRAFRGGFVYTRLERKDSRADFAARTARASLLLFALALIAPLAVLMGRRTLVRLWLRACVQAGHLWSLFGQSYEEYGAST
jgi:succinoglycan biosynthesis protein ExoM